LGAAARKSTHFLMKKMNATSRIARSRQLPRARHGDLLERTFCEKGSPPSSGVSARLSSESYASTSIIFDDAPGA
jgi:hypothetical protein